MKILRESIINEHDWKQPGDDSRTARIQLKSIQEKVEDLLSHIKDGDNLDAWVQMKITQAEDGLNSVRNYIVFEEDDEMVNTPEIVTDNPPANVAPEKSVMLQTPIDSEDELEMDDLGSDMLDTYELDDDFDNNYDDDYNYEDDDDYNYDDDDIEGAMKPASSIPLDLEDEEDLEESMAAIARIAAPIVAKKIKDKFIDEDEDED